MKKKLKEKYDAKTGQDILKTNASDPNGDAGGAG